MRAIILIVLAVALAIEASPKPFSVLDESLGRGFDAVSGSYKLPAVSFHYVNDQQWFNPFLSHVYSTPDECSGVTTLSQASSWTTVSKSFSQFAGEQARQRIGQEDQGYLYADSRVARASSFFNGEDNYVVAVEEEISLFEASLFPSEFLQPSPAFSEMVAALPTEYDAKAYRRFIRLFGTHYVSQATYGGEVNVQSSVASSYSGQSEQKAREQVFSIYTNYTASGSTANLNGNAQYNEAGLIDTTYFSSGGYTESFRRGRSEWAESVKHAPVAIRVKTEPLSSLVSDTVKGANLDRAASEYVKEAVPSAH